MGRFWERLKCCILKYAMHANARKKNNGASLPAFTATHFASLTQIWDLKQQVRLTSGADFRPKI
jgi:hypothetical protein